MFRVFLQDRRRERRSADDHDDGSAWISSEDLDGALSGRSGGHFRSEMGILAPVVTNPGCEVPLATKTNATTKEVIITGEYLQYDLLFKKTKDGWQGPYQTAILA